MPDGQKHYYGVVIRKLLYKAVFVEFAGIDRGSW